MSLEDLGAVHRGAGEYSIAKPLLERSLAILEKALGPKHPALVSPLNALSELLLNEGDPVRAKPILERAVALGERPTVCG